MTTRNDCCQCSLNIVNPLRRIALVGDTPTGSVGLAAAPSTGPLATGPRSADHARAMTPRELRKDHAFELLVKRLAI
jgi:hypothetical protein